MNKKDIVDEFQLYAELLRLDGEKSRAFAYEKASVGLSKAKFIPPNPALINGIGDSIRERIVDLDCGRGIGNLEQLKQRYPWYAELSQVDGLGPKRAQAIYDEFGITTVEELIDLGESITDVSGIGDKTASTVIGNAQDVHDRRRKSQDGSDFIRKV